MEKFWKTVGEILAFLFVVALLWHAKIFFFNTETPITGIFKVQPRLGYTWGASTETDERYFWQKTDPAWYPGFQVPGYNMIDDEKEHSFDALPGYEFISKTAGDFRTQWVAGQSHPDYQNIVSSKAEGQWDALPGYTFVTEGSLKTTWQPGLLNPKYMALSSKTEGQWHPYPGYEWNNDSSNDLSVHWVSGLRYPDFKIVSDSLENSYLAFPGYKFVDPENSLEVVWTPGIVDPNNPSQISGSIEGSWVVNDQNDASSDEPTPGTHFGNAVGLALLGKIGEWFFGKDNDFSNSAYHEGLKETVTGTVGLIEKK